MVLAHSLAMNGGVLHAVESLNSDDLAGAIAGYRFFALDAAATLLDEVAEEARVAAGDDDALDTLGASADERYAAIIPDDDVLITAFEARYRDDAGEFAPLD
jgi:hypothetical protein